MRCTLAITIGLAAALPAAPCLAGEAASAALTTAPIDYTLYREGEVRRSETYFGGWLLTCDAIRRLNRKFCSMRAAARAADGTVVGAIAISTDDRGRPAAIVTVPFGTVLEEGIGLSQPAADGRAKAAGAGRVVLRPAQCGGLGCQAVWPLDGDAIRRLRSGAPIVVRFAMRAEPSFPAPPRQAAGTVVSGTIAAAGFAEAVQASLP